MKRANRISANTFSIMDSARYKYHRLSFLMLVLCLVFVSCSANEPEEQTEPPAPVGWDYFDAFDPIGETYESISSKYDALDEEGVYDGGVVLKAGENLYFGFPCYSKEEIQGSDTCTSVYGTLGTVFGLTDSYASDELEKLLSVIWERDFEDLYYATVTRRDKSYTVRLDADNINELYSPDTGFAVFNYDGGWEETDPDQTDSDYVYVKLNPIESQDISGIGYDEEHSVMAIEFRKTQELWYYYDVPEEVYKGLESAESPLDYYYDNIRDVYISIEQR